MGKGKVSLRKLLFILIFMFVFCSCKSDFVIYPFKEDFDDWSELEAVIKNFDGEMFADKNITADGYYTGCRKVAENMVRCSDGTEIWFDGTLKNYYRTTGGGKKEKICPESECRSDIEKECMHMPFFKFIYSNGIIYFTYGGYDTVGVEYNGEMVQKINSKGVFIYRYDPDINEYDKLIGFQGVSECSLVLNGRYLFAQTFNWETSMVTGEPYKADFSITRIDLHLENAVVLYSDVVNRDVYDKLCDVENFLFQDEKIFMPVNDSAKSRSTVNICSIDMQNIRTLIELDYGILGNLYLYENYLYFIYNGRLCRVDIGDYEKYIKDEIVERDPDQAIDEEKAVFGTEKLEIIDEMITSFCIDGDYLYYTLPEDIGTHKNLYRIKLDYSSELKLDGSFAMYKTEKGDSFFNWKVIGETMYATMFPEQTEAGEGNSFSQYCFRQKLNATEKPYIFYKY